MPRKNTTDQTKMVLKPEHRQILRLMAGAGLLFVLGWVSIAASVWAGTELKNQGLPGILIHIGISMIGGLGILVCGWLMSFVFERPIASYLDTSAANIDSSAQKNKENADTAATTINDLKKEVSTLQGKIVKTIDQANIINNIGKIVLFGSYDNILQKFLNIIDKPQEKELYIIGTMLGVFGENSLSLAQQIHNNCVTEVGLELPFKYRAHIGVPGHKSKTGFNKVPDQVRCIYPFSARVAAIELLSAFANMNDTEALKNKLQGNKLEISIHYIERVDIFPAIQMWEDDYAMVICSTGADDRFSEESRLTAIHDSMQLAMIIQNEMELDGKPKKTNLKASLERVLRMIKNDYLTTKEDVVEMWTLDPVSMSISVKNYTKLYEETVLMDLVKRVYKDSPEKHTALKAAIDECSKGGEITAERSSSITKYLKEAIGDVAKV